MELTFANNRMRRICLREAEARRELGVPVAAQLMLRIKSLQAAQVLGDLLKPGVPGRWEVLKGDLAGSVSARLSANYRLIVDPPSDVAAAEAVSVEVVRVEDYH